LLAVKLCNGLRTFRVLGSQTISDHACTGASAGRKVNSRIDPLGIQANVPVFHCADDGSDWTISVDEAKKDAKGKPVLFSRTKQGGKGNPSAVNHSNQPPNIDEFQVA
jgi:hypothetical protein